MTAPFTIDKMATEFAEQAEEYRSAFERDKYLTFAQPFAPAMLDMLISRAGQARFSFNHVEHIGDREIETQQSVGSTVNLLLNREPFRQWIEAATGLTPIRSANGRLVQTCAGSDQSLTWHDDLEDRNRLLAVVINLSDKEFTGGEFQLREKGQAKLRVSHAYTRPGEMMVFAVRPDLEHRVVEVLSGGPRRVFAGWFFCLSQNNGL